MGEGNGGCLGGERNGAEERREGGEGSRDDDRVGEGGGGGYGHCTLPNAVTPIIGEANGTACLSCCSHAHAWTLRGSCRAGIVCSRAPQVRWTLCSNSRPTTTELLHLSAPSLCSTPSPLLVLTPCQCVIPEILSMQTCNVMPRRHAAFGEWTGRFSSSLRPLPVPPPLP